MPEIRERKKNDRIKGKHGGRHGGKDARRQITVKLQKALLARQRPRDAGGGADEAPEAQAAELTGEQALTSAGAVRERTGSGFSTAVMRYKRKQQKPRKAGDAQSAEAPAENAAPPARERVREKAADDMRTRRTENHHGQPAPKTRQMSGMLHERPAQRAPATRRGTEPRQKQPPPRERPAPTPLHEGDAQATPAANTAAAPPSQARMRQKAVTDIKAKRAGTGRGQPPPRMESPTEYRPVPARTSEHSVPPDDHPSALTIRERPRRGTAPKEKPAGGAIALKTRQSAAAGVPGLKTASATAKAKTAIPQPMRQARLRVQQNAQRRMLRQTKRTTRRAVDLSRRATAAVVKTVSSAISALAGLVGGAILLPVFIVIILIAAIISSPFGILFSNEPTPGATPLNIAVGQLNRELSEKLEQLQSGDYDSIDVQGQGPDWREVVAVFAAKTAGADDGVDVAALTPDRVDRLRGVFWDMCIVTSEVEEIDHPDSDPDDDVDDGWTEYILHITITAKTAEEMRTEYAFTNRQNEALTELLGELATMEILLTDLAASEEQARELIRNLPADLSPERRAVVETACQLVGKVTYFWGGKSLVIGWDSRWGQVQKVWADGSSTTGTYRPYGLDCSGFVDWTFYNATDGAYYPGQGGGTETQYANSRAISWDEAQPGDLVFYADLSHVGIVGGRDEDGNLRIVHCASGSINGVTITGADGFGLISRPLYYTE